MQRTGRDEKSFVDVSIKVSILDSSKTYIDKAENSRYFPVSRKYVKIAPYF